jgi:hypothetical protein
MESVGYSETRGVFRTLHHEVPELTLEPTRGAVYAYDRERGRVFIVLPEQFEYPDPVGKVTTPEGEELFPIPHPGKKFGRSSPYYFQNPYAPEDREIGCIEIVFFTERGQCRLVFDPTTQSYIREDFNVR